MDQTPGSNSGTSTSGQTAADEVKVKAQAAASQVKGKAQAAAQKIKEEGKQQLESGKQGAAQTADQLADAVNRASDELHHQDQHGLADYASQVASGISSFADTLRNRSIDDLLADTQALARRNPAVFFLGSIGVGLALSRFLKASARHTTGATDANYLDREDVSYGASSEWQQPEASQSPYGGQPGSSGATSSATSDTLSSTDSTISPPNNSPGGTYP